MLSAAFLCGALVVQLLNEINRSVKCYMLSSVKMLLTCSFAIVCLFCLFDLILYVPSTIFQLNRDGSSWVEPVLS